MPPYPIELEPVEIENVTAIVAFWGSGFSIYRNFRIYAFGTYGGKQLGGTQKYEAQLKLPGAYAICHIFPCRAVVESRSPP